MTVTQGANQSCVALGLICCSIEVDQGGTLYARARVSLVRWEGGSHVVLFMVPLGPPGARPMDQVLWLPFEYYYDSDSGFCLLLHTQSSTGEGVVCLVRTVSLDRMVKCI